MRQHIQLVVAIDTDGTYYNDWFLIVSKHRAKTAAKRRAIAYRKKGCLARVRRRNRMWVTAIRQPRKRSPLQRDLCC
jgi:hypothetical protein